MAKEHGGQEAKDLWRSFRKMRESERLYHQGDEAYRQWDIWMMRYMLLDQAQTGSPGLTEEQVQQIREEEARVPPEESIWAGTVRLIPAPGNQMLADQS